MAAAHTAVVTIEAGETIVRFADDTTLPAGSLSFEVLSGGRVLLTPAGSDDQKQKAWLAFLDHIDATPRDPDFMLDRPMNRPPVDRNLFPDD